MSWGLYLAYLVTCTVLILVPGPTVTLIMANSLRHGLRAGLLNVAGTQLGLATMMLIVALGLATVVATLEPWFDLVRLLGAAYLIWLGWRLLTQPGGLGGGRAPRPPRGGFLLQGYLVFMSNPKALLLFGALIPQFVDPAAAYLPQVTLLGGTAMACAFLGDSAYALVFSRARHVLTERRIRAVSRGAGALLVGGGIWMALARGR